MADVNFRLKITKTTPAEDIAEKIFPAMQRLGNAIGRRAQRLVPKRTWALHDSIATATSVSGTTVTTVVSMGTGYGLHVERGTSRQVAQPFMRPALLQSTSRDLRFGGSMADPHGALQVYITARGRRRLASAAQIANWTRGKK